VVYSCNQVNPPSSRVALFAVNLLKLCPNRIVIWLYEHSITELENESGWICILVVNQYTAMTNQIIKLDWRVELAHLATVTIASWCLVALLFQLINCFITMNSSGQFYNITLNCMQLSSSHKIRKNIMVCKCLHHVNVKIINFKHMY